MAKSVQESKPFYMNPWLIGGVIIVIVLVAMLVGMYNNFVQQRTNVDTQWSNVEVQYQRRIDLIPNLVETTKGYANYEQSTLTQITQLRSQWAAAKQSGDVQGQMQAANQLEGTISKLLLVSENYPQLKASEQFIALQDELAGTENRVAVSRMDYNTAVRSYNVAIRSVPGVFFAGMFGFADKPLFEAEAGAEQAPTVKF